MSGFPTANFGESEQGLFSPLEIRQLMRVEFVRAVRYHYPLTLMLIEVDRLEYLHDLYGYRSKEEILQALIALIRSVTRASDFLGCMLDERILAVFPHTPREAASALAGRLLRGSRRLEFQGDGRTLRATLSIGVAVRDGGGAVSFDDMLAAAEDAAEFASSAGGDRYVQRERAQSMIEELRADLEAQTRRLAEVQERMASGGASAPAAPAALPEPELAESGEERAVPAGAEGAEGPLGERVRELFAAMGLDAPAFERLQQDIVALAHTSIEDALQSAVSARSAEYEREVDLLERRVRKLKEVLDATEAELARVARMKGVDSGVASIYRTVQGLSDDETDRERKREMLTILFEANVELRRKIQGKT
jgi:diguanylate cyclase (GGDEF)-like protein